MVREADEKTDPAVSADQGAMARTIRNLWPYMWPKDRPDLKVRVVLAVCALVVAKVITILVPYTYKWVTDALTGEGSAPAIIPAFLVTPVMLVIAYALGRIMLIMFNQLRDALFARVGQYAVRRLAWKTFQHVHGLSLRFHLARRTGGLSRIIERGTKGIETIVRFTILNTAPTIVEFSLMAGIIWYQFGLTYVLVIAVTILLYVWYTVKASNWRISIRREMNDSDTDASSKAIDSLLNYETVKYFNNEGMETARFDKSMARYESAATKTWTSLAWLNIGQSVIFTIGLMICMIMSARAVMAGTQTIGDFVLINALLMQLAIPLNFIGFVYREIRQGLADIEAMFDLLGVEPEIKDKPGANPLVVGEGRIEFHNVRFHYDDDRPILRCLTFDVPAGSSTAIVGPSGAGKSTISRLLFRFYDVTDGQILIDGQDIRDVQQESVRASIGMVPQDTVLFNDTIGYNVRYGMWDADDQAVRDASQMAQIADFIERLPAGYDTQVGERGLKLSGGEKQRVAIARTILKAPPILILDEATSALDTATEQEIQSALDDVSKGRTTLVIAHRLSTVINADQIIVLQEGLIAERGTHAELLKQGGLYASMWERQRAVDEAAQFIREHEDDAGLHRNRPREAEDVSL